MQNERESKKETDEQKSSLLFCKKACKQPV
jgi:hypothetical protein